MTRLETTDSLIGRTVERVEDAGLLTGRGRYIDDLPVRRDTAHMAILRSPHGHAEITAIDTTTARALPGVLAVITGDAVARLTRSMTVGVKANVECWPIARDRVRYVGEPVALVVAENRYVAEDALDLIEVGYQTLSAVVDPERALAEDAPVLRSALGTNLISERSFRYGDPEVAFAAAAHRIAYVSCRWQEVWMVGRQADVWH